MLPISTCQLNSPLLVLQPSAVHLLDVDGVAPRHEGLLRVRREWAYERLGEDRPGADLPCICVGDCKQVPTGCGHIRARGRCS